MKKKRVISKSIIFGMIFLLSLMSWVMAAYLEGEVGFNLNVNGGVICTNGGTLWDDWMNASNHTQRNTTGVNGKCYDANGIEENGQRNTMCCPLGSTCTNMGGTNYTCVVNGKYFCQDFNGSSDECTGTVNGVVSGNVRAANFTVVSAGGICGIDPRTWTETGYDICYNQSACSCKWNGSATNASNKCYPYEAKNKTCVNVTTHVNFTISSSCDWQLTSWNDSCADEGYILASWKGILTPSNGEAILGCDGTEQLKRIDCSSIVKMDFFDKRNFIITIISLIFIYILYFMYKKDSQSKKQCAIIQFNV